MPSAKQAQNDDNAVELHEVVVERGHPLIPDAQYLARFNGHDACEITSFKDRAGNFPVKVFLRFTILDGEYAGLTLFRAYRAKRLFRKAGKIGVPIKNGRFALAPRSQLLKDVCRALDIRSRPDRLSLRPMKECLWKITTRTVTTGMENKRQTPLPEALRYSVVAGFTRETGR